MLPKQNNNHTNRGPQEERTLLMISNSPLNEVARGIYRGHSPINYLIWDIIVGSCLNIFEETRHDKIIWHFSADGFKETFQENPFLKMASISGKYLNQEDEHTFHSRTEDFL